MRISPLQRLRVAKKKKKKANKTWSTTQLEAPVYFASVNQFDFKEFVEISIMSR